MMMGAFIAVGLPPSSNSIIPFPRMPYRARSGRSPTDVIAIGKSHVRWSTRLLLRAADTSTSQQFVHKYAKIAMDRDGHQRTT